MFQCSGCPILSDALSGLLGLRRRGERCHSRPRDRNAEFQAFQGRSLLDADLLDNIRMKERHVAEVELAHVGDVRGEQGECVFR